MAISLRFGSGLIPAEPLANEISQKGVLFRVSLRKEVKFPALMIRAASKPAAGTVRRGTGVMKPRRVSMEMREFLGGVVEIGRGQAVKEIWAYVKLHNLQDTNDKKLVHCDEKLKRILGGRDQVSLHDIARLINPHFLK